MSMSSAPTEHSEDAARSRPDICVREFREGDAADVLDLMTGLAEFENYREEFAVTVSDLVRRGIGKERQFVCFVAEDSQHGLVGMAVCYSLPFTYDLSPELVLKELFVKPDFRSQGLGQALMEVVASFARTAGCKRVKFLVLPDNVRARRFYSELGASQDTKWENWILPVQINAGEQPKGDTP